MTRKPRTATDVPQPGLRHVGSSALTLIPPSVRTAATCTGRPTNRHDHAPPASPPEVHRHRAQPASPGCSPPPSIAVPAISAPHPPVTFDVPPVTAPKPTLLPSPSF